MRWLELRGQPMVLNLWASWCAPCREEMPLLQAAYESESTVAGDAPPVLLLGIDIRDDSGAAVALLTDLGISYPQLDDPEGQMLDELALPGLPVTLAVDAAGTVVETQVGQMDAGRLRELVEIAGRQPPG